MPPLVPPEWAGLSLQPLLELASLYEQRGETKMRDRFLILAACRYQDDGQFQEADRLLHHLLKGSPHHLLQSYTSMRTALEAEPVRDYLQDLWQNYPPQTVVGLLSTLLQRPVTLPTAKPRPTSSLPTRPPVQPIAPSPTPATSKKVPAPIVTSSVVVPEAYSIADPVLPQHEASAHHLPHHNEEEGSPGINWVGFTLAIALILAGIAWLGHLLLKPLLR